MKETAPFYSIRGRDYHPHIENYPGPGSYSPSNSILSSSPKYRLGTSQRGPLSSEIQTPGPGTYSPRSTISTPAWTLLGKTGRDNFNRTFDNYSSNTYKTPLSQGSPRGQNVYNTDPQAFKGNNLNNGTERYYSTGRNSVPGPGVYEIKPKKEGPSFSFRPKFNVKLRYNVPGPGNYKPSNMLTSDRSPAWIVGKSQKCVGNVEKDAEHSPGPGTYLKNSTLTGPYWRFGSSTRTSNSLPKVPGPGSYEVVNSFGKSPPYVHIKN